VSWSLVHPLLKGLRLRAGCEPVTKTQESIMQYGYAFENAMASIYMPNDVDTVEAVPIFVPPNLPPDWQEIIAEVARVSPDMNIPNPDDLWEEEVDIVQSSAQTERERLVQSLAREHRGKTRIELDGVLGAGLGAAVADAMRSQVQTARGVFTKYQQQEREAKRELGKGLAAAGIEVQHHSVKDYIHVIVTQLDLFQDGAIHSVNAVVNAAFPNDPKKAKSIESSQHGKRRKQAWNSPEVMNHPIEKVMQLMHGKHDMNRRDSARTFGQSLSMNTLLFTSSSRIAKQGAEIDQLKARVQELEQRMDSTKNREALADAGATSSRDMVLALSAQGKKPTEITKLLDMSSNTVKSIIRRSKNR